GPPHRAEFARSRHRDRYRGPRHRPSRQPHRGHPHGGDNRAEPRQPEPLMTIDDLPPLREVIARHGLMARKALGQNFLLDLNLTRRIARAAGPLDGHVIYEVGPGPGGLTRALLLEGASRVVAVE